MREQVGGRSEGKGGRKLCEEWSKNRNVRGQEVGVGDKVTDYSQNGGR